MTTFDPITEMRLDGGAACLDLVNSGVNTYKDVTTERLHTYQDLLILASRLSLIDKKQQTQLAARANKNPKAAQAVLALARECRAAMQEVFGKIADKKIKEIDKRALDRFNAFITAAVSKQIFQLDKKILTLGADLTAPHLNSPIELFAISAYELLRFSNQDYIKRCGRCQWLFIDQTKSHRRKWCSMEDCGSIVKSSRYYKRKRSTE